MSLLNTKKRICTHASEVPFRQLARHREVPAAAPRSHGGPLQVRLRVREDRRGHRQRTVLPPSQQPVHRRGALHDDRSGPQGRRHRQLQHRPGGGPEQVLSMGRSRGVHVPSVRPRLHQQPDDPPAVRGGGVRGEGLAAVRQGPLLGDGDPQEDPRGRGVEASGPLRRRRRHRQHRRCWEDRVDIRR